MEIYIFYIFPLILPLKSIWFQAAWCLLCYVRLPSKTRVRSLCIFFFFQYLFLTVINSRLKVCSHIVWTLFVLAILCRTSSQCLSAAPPPTPPFKPKTLLDAGQPFPHLPTNPGPFPCLLFLFIPLSAPPPSPASSLCYEVALRMPGVRHVTMVRVTACRVCTHL